MDSNNFLNGMAKLIAHFSQYGHSVVVTAAYPSMLAGDIITSSGMRYLTWSVGERVEVYLSETDTVPWFTL